MQFRTSLQFRNWFLVENFSLNTSGGTLKKKLPQIFLKNGPFSASFLYFCLFNTADINMFNINFCRWLDLNCRPLELEATALPTEPQPLPCLSFYVRNFFISLLTNYVFCYLNLFWCHLKWAISMKMRPRLSPEKHYWRLIFLLTSYQPSCGIGTKRFKRNLWLWTTRQ